jgi:hypothetical protein
MKRKGGLSADPEKRGRQTAALARSMYKPVPAPEGYVTTKSLRVKLPAELAAKWDSFTIMQRSGVVLAGFLAEGDE